MSDYVSNELQGDLPEWPEWKQDWDDLINWDGGEDWVTDWVGVEDDAAPGR